MKLFFIFNFILNTIMSQTDYSDPTSNQLNKTSQYEGLMYNMKALYESDPVSFDLIYFIKLYNITELKPN